MRGRLAWTSTIIHAIALFQYQGSGFTVKTAGLTNRVLGNEPPRSSTAGGPLRAEVATNLKNFGPMIGDQIASAIVKSPFYPVLISQAKATMKKNAEVRNMICFLQ